MRTDLPIGGRSTGLVDVLDRVLDKGLLVAGDIRVSLAEVELLTIRIRLVICSMDKAQEMGLDWWKHDNYFAPGRQRLAMENQALRRQVRDLERRVAALDSGRRAAVRAQSARPRKRVISPESRGD
ncbi:MAG: gas vesicle protein GvpJ [Candidatus Rokuibacteriota bacterium]